MPVGEGLELLVQLLLLLLAHRPAQQVGLAQRVAGELLGDRHHLLLVDDQAVGLAQDLLERLGELGVDRRRPPRGRSCGGRTCCGSRRPSGRAGRARRPRRCPRSVSGRMLRSSARIGPPSSWKTPRVSPRWSSCVRRRVGRARGPRARPSRRGWPRCFDQRVVEDREVAQPEEVHLDQAERLAGRVVELRDHRAVGRAPEHRDDVDAAARWT